MRDPSGLQRRELSMKYRIAVLVFLFSFFASWALSAQSDAPRPEKKKSIL